MKVPARTYPYTAYRLMPSYSIQEVTLTGPDWVGCSYGWDVTESKKSINSTTLFPTREAAIAAGWKKVRDQSKRIEKMSDTLDKHRANLAKAEAL